MKDINEFIQYIDKAIENRDYGDSYWIDERGIEHTTDVGYGIEWWEIMKDELKRVYKSNEIETSKQTEN